MPIFRLMAPHRAEPRFGRSRNPGAGSGDVLIRVGATGACHSDLHIIDEPDALGMLFR